MPKLHILYYGFHGRPDFGSLGWGTVSVYQTEGESILIDAGGPSQRNFFAKRLDAIGVNPKDIGKVYLTHSHWDHIYNIDLFPNATLFLSKEEYEFAKSGKGLAVHPYFVEQLKKRKLELFDDEDELPCGVKAYMTPGHTPGSASFVLKDDELGDIVIAGDALKNRAELGGNVSQTLNAEMSNASIRRILELAHRILPGHDGWIVNENGHYIAKGGNDVVFLAPQGMKINGRDTLTLVMDL